VKDIKLRAVKRGSNANFSSFLQFTSIPCSSIVHVLVLFSKLPETASQGASLQTDEDFVYPCGVVSCVHTEMVASGPNNSPGWGLGRVKLGK
jgi:hypothetical protein